MIIKVITVIAWFFGLNAAATLIVLGEILVSRFIWGRRSRKWPRVAYFRPEGISELKASTSLENFCRYWPLPGD